MQRARRIQHIYFKDNAWIAVDVHDSIIQSEKVIVDAYYPSLVWDVPLKPKIFGMGNKEPDEMTLHELRQFLRAQKSTNQFAMSYRLDYWQRIFQPLTTLVMMMLAIPFIFGPLRSSTMGSKLLAGATVGFGFYILNRFLGPLSMVLQWPPILAAAGPTFVFALLGIYLMRASFYK